MKTLSNAKRFINAYNQIDYSLRVQHNFKRSMGFSDMIRRAVSINHIVRKYEDDLIDFGRLRNAIIHGSNDDVIIAEPHEDVVLKIEHLERLITTPPKALDVLNEKDVLTVNFDMSIKDVIKKINEEALELRRKLQVENEDVYNLNIYIGISDMNIDNLKLILNQLLFLDR